MLALDLATGQHAIASAMETPLEGAALDVTIDGRPADLDQQVLPRYTGGGLLVGTLRAEPGLYALSAAPAPAVTLNGFPLEAVAGPLWLGETNAIEARLDRPETVPLGLRRIRVEGEPLVARVVEALPDGAHIIEAETFSEHGLGSPSRYSHRTFLSGGVGVGEWIVPGMWLRWRLEPPAPGRYRLIVKGATHEPQADRVILLDGEPLGGTWRVFRFEHTGGFGATPEEWAQMEVVDEAGAPLVLDLGPGAHDLRMICIDGRLNLDCLALAPAG